jgi:4-oxalocrotonate tautomerase
MPHVIVKLWPGKSEQQKAQLAREVTKSVMSVLDYGAESVSVGGAESVSVGFEEISSKDWAEKVYRPEIKAKWQELYKKPDYSM